MRNYDKGVINRRRRGDFSVLPPSGFLTLTSPPLGTDLKSYRIAESSGTTIGGTIPWLRPVKVVSMDGNNVEATAALLSINAEKAPSGQNGFFNNVETEKKLGVSGYEMIDNMTRKIAMQNMSVCPSKEAELEQLNKAIDQSGQAGCGWIPNSGVNPLVNKTEIEASYKTLIDEAFEALRARKAATLNRKIMPGSVFDASSNARYTTGSSYGIHGYAPGSSPFNIKSLKYHANVAKAAWLKFKRGGGYGADDFGDPSLSSFKVASSMLLPRGGFIGRDKEVTSWEPSITEDSKLVLTQASSTTGSYRRTRIIRALAANYNILSFDSNAYSAEYINGLPAHHLGDYAINAIGIYQLASKLNGAIRTVKAKDQKAFDQHVSGYFYGKLISIRAAECDTPDFFEHHYGYKATMPTYTAFKDSSKRKILFAAVDKEYEVDSGDMETWTWDHDVNEVAIVVAMARTQGWTIKQTLHSCATFHNYYHGSKTWFFVIKGDDTIIATTWILDSEAFDGHMKGMQLETTNEKATALLMNFIDFHKVQYYGQHFIIPAARGKRGYLSYGLLGKRLASKIFPEYGTDNKLVASISLYESIKTCQLSPVFPLFTREINQLCSLVDMPDFASLDAYCNSAEFRQKLMTATESVSAADAYIKDRYKRLLGDQGFSSEVQDPDIMEMVKTYAERMGLSRPLICELADSRPEATASQMLKDLKNRE